MNHVFHIFRPGMKYLGQHLFGGFKFQLLCADPLGQDRICFSSPKSHENTSNVACDPGIFISAFALPFAGAFGIS